MRGGISMVSRRYAKTNNPQVKGHSLDKPTIYFQYLDANNLYRWAMSQPLPTGEFEWVDLPSIQTILDHTDKTDKRYILEVDLEHPSNLQQEHKASDQMSGGC